MISSFVRALISAFKARRGAGSRECRSSAAACRPPPFRETAAALSKVDREFWVLLRRIWTDWESILVIVKPETVVRWHPLWVQTILDLEEPTA